MKRGGKEEEKMGYGGCGLKEGRSMVRASAKLLFRGPARDSERLPFLNSMSSIPLQVAILYIFGCLMCSLSFSSLELFL